MITNKFNFLLKKYEKGDISSIEFEELINVLKELDINDEVLFSDIFLEGADLSDRKYKKIISSSKKIVFDNNINTSHIFFRKKMIPYVSFIVGFLLIFLGIFFIWNIGKSKPKVDYYSGNNIIQLQLPDKTIVVLKPNSHLRILSNFSGIDRSVFLEGDAYFDVFHNPQKQFIIYSQLLETTVLGTAFEINNRINDSVAEITVTRGLVKVDHQNKKQISYLKKNNQLVFDKHYFKTIQKTVNSDTIVNNWIEKDLKFNNVKIKDIIEVLNKRYQVTIKLKNIDLSDITIVTKFKLNSSVEDNIELLCLILNTKYEKNKGVYYIF